jgi:hypothetical protein
MKCPQCGNEWTPDASEIAAEFGRRTSRAKARASRRNAKLGGWPKGKKRGKRKPDANQIAHGVVAKAERLTRQGRVPPKLKALPNPKSPKRAH